MTHEFSEEQIEGKFFETGSIVFFHEMNQGIWMKTCRIHMDLHPECKREALFK